MGATLDYWRRVVADHSGFLARFIALLAEGNVRYAVIGGVA